MSATGAGVVGKLLLGGGVAVGGRSAEVLAPLTSSAGSWTCSPASAESSFSAACVAAPSCEVLAMSCDARGEGASLGNSFAVGLGRSVLSVEVRVGASRLWRGLPWVDMEFRPADFAASALARRSWRRSLGRAVEADLERPVDNPRSQEHCYLRMPHPHGPPSTTDDILGVCFAGEAGFAGLASRCCEALSSSARMLSRRASTPATAWERKEPHRLGAAIAGRETERDGWGASEVVWPLKGCLRWASAAGSYI